MVLFLFLFLRIIKKQTDKKEATTDTIIKISQKHSIRYGQKNS